MGTVPTPPSPVPGQFVSGRMLNDLSGGMEFLGSPPRCYAFAATPTSIPSSGTTPAVIALDGEVYDIVQTGDQPIHDLATNNSRLYVRTAGKYEVSGQVGFASNATGPRAAYVYLNAGGNPAAGTNLFATTQGAVGGGFPTGVPIPTFEVPLNVGDYLEVFGLQASGGTLNTSTGQGATYLRMKWSGR